MIQCSKKIPEIPVSDILNIFRQNTTSKFFSSAKCIKIFVTDNIIKNKKSQKNIVF